MTPGITEEMARALARDRTGLIHASTADRVTELLRTHIMEGLFPPGTRLSEEVLGQALGVSRNTLREAFRLLCHERLAVHQMNRGIFVPVLTPGDVTDIYALRRLVEGSAARMAAAASMTRRLAVRAAVEAAEAAAEAGRWFEVRSADLHFHQAIAALAGSARVDELMRRALAELGLIFHVMADPEHFHGPFIQRNRVIAEKVMLGHGEAAEADLLAYLADAERQILDAYRTAGRPTVPRPSSAAGGPAVPAPHVPQLPSHGLPAAGCPGCLHNPCAPVAAKWRKHGRPVASRIGDV